MPPPEDPPSRAPAPGRPPFTGVLLVNPGSGPRPTPADDLARAFPELELREGEPDDLAAAAADAVSAGASVVAVAGGDGTVRCVAAAVAGGSTALLVVPAGTRNHFARALGIATLDDAAAALAAGTRRQVDLAEVNGRAFCNTSSVGLYAWVVRERQQAGRRRWKAVTGAASAFRQLRRRRALPVRIEGTEHRSWVVFVGNNDYGTDLADLAERDGLDAGRLDVRLLRADEPRAALRVAFALAAGRLEHSPLVERMTPAEIELDLPLPAIDVALDGDVVTLRPPLRYRTLPGALTVLAPPSLPDPDPRRSGRTF